MKTAKIVSLTGEECGSHKLDHPGFLVPINKLLVSRVVHWNLANRQSGCHKTKTISEINASTKKRQAQKGAGKSRMGHSVAPQRRGGAVAHGPVSRSHAYSLNKKIRKIGTFMALSSKLNEQSLFIINESDFVSGKTKEIKDFIEKFSFKKILFVGHSKLEQQNTLQSVRNMEFANFLPLVGLNAYDILNHNAIFFFNGVIDSTITKLTNYQKSVEIVEQKA